MLQLTSIKGAIQDKRSFSTSCLFFVPLQTLLTLSKTWMGVMNS
jgi:hypothetical protein